MGNMPADEPIPEQQLEEIDRLLTDSGFAYDEEQNIFYSLMDPWQRELGYCSLYDDWAVPMGMVFDCEPVHFDYGGKKWLIEFWKGLYGITIGGEIGVYNTTEPDIDMPGVFSGTFYHSASNEELLDMSFALSKDGDALFYRADKHWWLTGFVLGEYADPSLLAMDASVTLRDRAMRDAFTGALLGLGYRKDEIEYSGNTVRLIFESPRSKQPLMRNGTVCDLTMKRTRRLVNEFKDITDGQTDLYGMLAALKENSPELYDMALNFGKQKDLLKHYDQIRSALG